jgi:aminoglycoside phosphotransferase (APT) family kinase protein
VTRSPLALAALASAAVPGLAPVSVQGVTARTGEQYQVAFLEDQEGRRWVVRLPLNAVAAAQLDEGESLTRLLARRMPFAVPVPQGYAQLKEGGRAAVYPRLAGEPLDWTQLPAGSRLAAEVGRAIAAVHNVDRGLYDEAGTPSYDADTYRTRRLADLDRGAATGHVPTGLLSRWEHALEEVTLWRFATCPVHGNLTDRHVLVAYDGSDDAGAGTVKGLTGWERAQVADPADDFGTLVTGCAPAAFDTVLEAYSHARAERPDKHLERRARLAGELRGLTALLEAVTSEDDELVESRAQALRRLDEHAHDTDLLPPPTRSVPAGSPAFADSLEGGELPHLDADTGSTPEAAAPSTDDEGKGLDQGGAVTPDTEPAMPAPAEREDGGDHEAAVAPSAAAGDQQVTESLEFDAPAGDEEANESLEFGAPSDAHVPQFDPTEAAEPNAGDDDPSGPSRS